VENSGTTGQATDANITWRIRFSCWITKTTHTQTLKYVILIAFPRQKRSRERAAMLHYKLTACLVLSSEVSRLTLRRYNLQFNRYVPRAFPPAIISHIAKLTSHLHLVPMLRMRGAIPPLAYPFMKWCLIKHGFRTFDL